MRHASWFITCLIFSSLGCGHTHKSAETTEQPIKIKRLEVEKSAKTLGREVEKPKHRCEERLSDYEIRAQYEELRVESRVMHQLVDEQGVHADKVARNLGKHMPEKMAENYEFLSQIHEIMANSLDVLVDLEEHGTDGMSPAKKKETCYRLERSQKTMKAVVDKMVEFDVYLVALEAGMVL